ncbi:Arylsulfatase [Pontiella desulfatans]|uniref:Arylsulfatase n=1 Tax=Pontiella desulfatans TaxID=2750659 RepID=A0A6C2U2I9_PONDE|nr:sulfatase-like hydrolase/transferase [Pontiella desulfatans]SPS73907.1 sulfatase S1_21 [Kiritimatiellales bacterium]VGO14009.1 Arylsulfatase [Pontiella desulfatans]
MMKKTVCLFGLLWAGLALAADQPNIVFILSDDQGWRDYGFMGHETIQTPALDKLADSSLVFDRGYVASPLCRPSLASLATGRYPFEHGVVGNDVDGKNNRAELDQPVKDRFHTFPSFVKLLSENGYLTHQSGKWWEGSFQDGGFTHGMTHGDPARKGRHGDVGLRIGRDNMTPVTEFIDRAVEEEKPFLLWYAPFLPHTPHNPPKRLLDKYSEEGRSADIAKYYAMCEWFDETCGTLLDALDERGLRENTLILYICDNGWAPYSSNLDDPNQKTWKGFALRSKGSPFEMGIRSPIMVSWPGHAEVGRSPDLAHAIDFFPTIAAAAGVEAPAGLPGINLLDEDAVRSRQTVFGVCNTVMQMSVTDPDDTLQYLWCIEGDWKLILRYPGRDTSPYRKLHAWDKAPLRLYNVKNDPHEKNDLAAAHPKTVARLKTKIEVWRSN